MCLCGYKVTTPRVSRSRSAARKESVTFARVVGGFGVSPSIPLVRVRAEPAVRVAVHEVAHPPLVMVRGLGLVEVVQPLEVTGVALQVRAVPLAALQLHLVQLQVRGLIVRSAAFVARAELPPGGQHEQRQHRDRDAVHPPLLAPRRGSLVRLIHRDASTRPPSVVT